MEGDFLKAKIYNMKNKNRNVLGEVVPLATPYIVVVEPSGFCNLKCVFCPINDDKYKNTIKRKFMEFKLFKKLVEDIKYFPNKLKVLRFIGNGEPLMNSSIVEMIKYAKKKEIAEKIEITTNGTLLNHSLSESLINSGLDILKISVEALNEKDFFEIAKYKINMVDYINNIKFFYLNRKQCRVYIKINNLALKSDKEEKEFFSTYGDYADEIFIENISPVWPNFDNGLNLKYSRGRFGNVVFERKICSHIFKSITVCADGEVIPCCADWQRKLKIGDITNESLIDIWGKGNLNRLQNLHLTKGKKSFSPCKECLYNEYCDDDILDEYELDILKRMEK